MNRDKTKTAVVVDENDRLLGVVNRSKFFEFPDEDRKSVKLDSVIIKTDSSPTQQTRFMTL